MFFYTNGLEKCGWLPYNGQWFEVFERKLFGSIWAFRFFFSRRENQQFTIDLCVCLQPFDLATASLSVDIFVLHKCIVDLLQIFNRIQWTSIERHIHIKPFDIFEHRNAHKVNDEGDEKETKATRLNFFILSFCQWILFDRHIPYGVCT